MSAAHLKSGIFRCAWRWRSRAWRARSSSVSGLAQARLASALTFTLLNVPAAQRPAIIAEADAALARAEALAPNAYSTADARFLPLMEKLGYVDYWKQTKTQPDVCGTPEERDFPVCVALRESR